MSPASLLVFSASLLLGLLPGALATTQNNLTVTAEPTKVQPYVIPYLNGFGVQTFGYVVRFLATNVSTAGAISMVLINGPKESAVPVHYHSRYHEVFFVAKGAVNLFVQNETRRLGPMDIGSVPPGFNHSFELLEPDTEIVGAVTPGGFSFYQQVGEPYAPAVLAPFPAADALPDANLSRVLAATGLYYDYNPTDYKLNYNMINGTTNGSQPWHNGNNTLPGSPTPYFVAGGWGPKYLHPKLGRVTHLYTTGAESNNVMTISTITMRAARQNETSFSWRSDVAFQLFRVLEGQLYIRMQNQTATLQTGDTAMVPRGVEFGFWSEVALTKVHTVAAVQPGLSPNSSVFGVAHDFLADSKPWDYAVFPDYY
ncbi:hypothetical protein M409DRAFT_22391 [Zasmidium cellare ATCC 36951]|uniref:Cupin type-1 domain-containing protein n=1 Tax=Zasmidium cellare ATCC 36951 TaxID=1080233 RepID=A0A6A6CMZ3_ZASCE|nr:uncharacterized protein M409DRAFT_22391 [Zasmidium cellare ATCC 36951]KAF2167588.1 hypothetical protein M409DRAFT_22391 [Zasmidium cellare ATCC 36951]